MPYTLTLDSIDLAADPELGGEQLQWTDEHEWDPVEQNQDRSLGGALMVQEGAKLYGRPITLASNDAAWFTKVTVDALQALRDQPGIVMLLTLPGGQQHHVTWNRVAGAPVEAVPLFRQVVYSSGDLFLLTLRLITVAPPSAPTP